MAIQHLDLEEQEQLEKIKYFWSQYGRFIILATVLLLLVIGGWSAWQYWQNKQAEGAAVIFTQFERAVAQKDVVKAKEAIVQIQTQYAKSDATPVLSLVGVNFMVQMKDLAAAKELLGWMVDKSNEPGLKALAVLRLADLSINDKEYERAISVLSTKVPEEFAGLVEDKRGNVFYAQGKLDDAKAAYSRAYTALQGNSYQKEVEGKLIMLGVDPATFAADKKG